MMKTDLFTEIDLCILDTIFNRSIEPYTEMSPISKESDKTLNDILYQFEFVNNRICIRGYFDFEDRDKLYRFLNTTYLGYHELYCDYLRWRLLK